MVFIILLLSSQWSTQKAVSSRVPLQAGVASAHWTYTQSVFFASTVLTTIGKQQWIFITVNIFGLLSVKKLDKLFHPSDCIF